MCGCGCLFNSGADLELTFFSSSRAFIHLTCASVCLSCRVCLFIMIKKTYSAAAGIFGALPFWVYPRTSLYRGVGWLCNWYPVLSRITLPYARVCTATAYSICISFDKIICAVHFTGPSCTYTFLDWLHRVTFWICCCARPPFKRGSPRRKSLIGCRTLIWA